jgi:hypothetical protein
MRNERTLGTLRHRAAALLAAGTLSLTAAAVPILRADAGPPPQPDPCPQAYPVEGLERDQEVTGLTVATGTEPEPFTGTVLGVVKDGIGADLDMIMVRLTSTEIDRVGGIWAGMSGSPVYAKDGRLIGAVSYGLAFGPSPVAGVTPAEDMQALLSEVPAGRMARGASKVGIPEAAAREMVASGEATSAQADEGLNRLPVPLGVSGMVSSARLAEVNKLLGMDEVRLYRAGSVSEASVEQQIVPGGNLAASMAYGDLSAVGIGTVTMVCGSEVVGFGHPFSWLGATTLSLHGADAVYVQEDPTRFPFKVANAGAPVGTIDQDRLAGIKGVLGALPDTVTVTTIVNTASGRSRTGVTEVSVPDFLPDAAAFGLLVNQDRMLDRVGAGSALVHFTISGVTAEGEPFTLARTNRQSSQRDISYQTIFELGSYANEILTNDFTDVTFTDIDVTVTLNDAPRAFRVGKVEAFRNGVWSPVTSESIVNARSGSTLKVRTTLTSYRNRYGVKTVTQSLVVPRAPIGSRGRLVVSGGGGERYEDEEEFPEENTGPTSFEELVADLSAAPRNDQLTATLELFRVDRLITRRTKAVVGEVVEGSRYFWVRVVR